MAEQIAAHVTLTYPVEVPSVEELSERVAAAATETQPFELQLGAIRCFGEADDGVFVEVIDRDGGWAGLRERIGASGERLAVEPHVTIVHPRTSSAGSTAWRELAGTEVMSEMLVTQVAVTAFDGRVWQTLSSFELGGALLST